MKNNCCYWSVVDGSYVGMMAGCIRSARGVGVFKDFHVWSPRPVEGATTHYIAKLDKTLCLFKLLYLRDEVSKLPYEYFIWVDADTWFVRHPGDVLQALRGAPVHISLESDAAADGTVRLDWWDCPLPEYVKLMRRMGVRSKSVFNMNAGFWIVHREVIATFCALCLEFWNAARKVGYIFTEEAPMAYAAHMLCGNPYEHTLKETSDLWASDWTGAYAGRLPDGQPWSFQDYFNAERFMVNPAIVHAMRSKEALVGSTGGK